MKVQRANCQQQTTSYTRLARTIEVLSRTIETLDSYENRLVTVFMDYFEHFIVVM